MLICLGNRLLSCTLFYFSHNNFYEFWTGCFSIGHLYGIGFNLDTFLPFLLQKKVIQERFSNSTEIFSTSHFKNIWQLVLWNFLLPFLPSTSTFIWAFSLYFILLCFNSSPSGFSLQSSVLQERQLVKFWSFGTNVSKWQGLNSTFF